MDETHFVGSWQSRYVYGATASGSPLASEHTFNFVLEDDQLVGKSVNPPSGEEVILRLRLDKDVLTGTFWERTSLTGHYKGMIFHGGVQFLVNGAGTELRGKWIGFNSSRTKIKTGEWSLTKK